MIPLILVGALALVCGTVQAHEHVGQHERVARQAEPAGTSAGPRTPRTPGTVAATTRAAAGAATAATSASVPTTAPRNEAAAAGASPSPLTNYKYAYDEVPYKVMPQVIANDASYRGPQAGYNICNSTTAGVTSECQTLIVNTINDFCLWGVGDDQKNVMLGDIEGGVVAYCLNETWGARPLPSTAIKGLQYLRTPSYVQIIGSLDLTALGYAADDSGGELDPHGADLLGNPVGGLVYSNQLPSGDNSTLEQVVEWNIFFDGPMFCMKLCDPTKATGGKAGNLCFNEYDTVGCRVNMPSSVYESLEGRYEECEGEDQDRVGVYTGTDGKTSEWPRPSSDAEIAAIPYTPRIPASSNCKTYAATELFAAASTSAATSATMTSGASASASGASAGNANQSQSAPSASPTSGSSRTVIALTTVVGVFAGMAVVMA